MDDFKRRAEAARERREAILGGRTADPLCKHYVARKAVEQMRAAGGGYIPCVKCGKLLRISKDPKPMPDGSML